MENKKMITELINDFARDLGISGLILNYMVVMVMAHTVATLYVRKFLDLTPSHDFTKEPR